MVGLLVGLFLATALIEKRHRDEAIQAGVAEYCCDPKTGKTTFHYITQKP